MLGEEDPETLEDHWQKMSDDTLRRRHQSRIQPVDDASKTSLAWALGGLAGMVVGVGVAAGTQEESKTTATVFGVSGLAIGLVGAIGALATQPSGPAQLEAEARRKLFIPDEDDMLSVKRAVNQLNGAQRKRCGGASVPFPEPTTLPPATKPSSSVGTAVSTSSTDAAPSAPPEPAKPILQTDDPATSPSEPASPTPQPPSDDAGDTPW